MLKSKSLIIFFVVIAAFASITAYQYYNEDTSDFEAARKLSNEQFLELEAGNTRYQIFGQEGNPTIVLIHSFNGFLESWNPNIEYLVKAGYRIVVYDLWGRGLSSSPRTNLSLTVFRDQLDAIINHSGATKVYLVGSSFGCVIAADYALHNPGRVEKLVFIGPAGFPSETDKTSELVNAPILGDVIFHYFGKRILKEKVEAYFVNKEANWAIEMWEKYAEYPGFTRSALSTLRHSPVLDYTEGWRNQGSLGKPILFVWGKQDVSFPYSNTEKAAALMPHAEIVAIEGAAHWLNIEKPLPVNEAIVSFLAK